MLALISLALGADTVVYHDGEATAALSRVSAAAGVPATELQAVRVGELMANRSPTVVNGGSLTTCAGVPSTGESIKQSLVLAEGAIKYMEYGSARAALDTAIRGLGCLQSSIDAAQASRAYYLRGIVNATSGDQAASREDFRRARQFAPTMTWDDNFAPAARGTFDAIANEMKSAKLVNLTVLPTPAEGTLQVDGRPIQLIDGHVGLTPGEHHLQIGQSPVATFTMTLDGSENPTLVLPSLVGPEVLGWASDGEKRAALTAVLVSAIGREGAVYVVNSDVMWRVKLGGSAWDLVGLGGPASAPRAAGAALPAAGVATTDGAPKKKVPVGPLLIGSGGAVAVAGAVVGYLGIDQALDARERYLARIDAGEAVDGSDTSDPDIASYVAGGQQSTIGWAVAGVGAAVLATGLVVTVAF